MSRSSTILRNVASNWAGFAVNAAVTLALTPFVLHELGTTRYGIWILTSSIIGYYGLLDLGFRGGVTQYLTRYLATGEDLKASECISSAVAVLASLGVVMAGLSLGAAYLVPHVLTIPADLQREAFWCILIVGCSSALQFALQPFASVFTATQRFDLATLIGILTRFLTAGGILLALKTGQGLVGVSVATCVTSAVDYVVRWRVAQRLAPQIEVAAHHVSMLRLRERVKSRTLAQRTKRMPSSGAQRTTRRRTQCPRISISWMWSRSSGVGVPGWKYSHAITAPLFSMSKQA